MSTVKHTPGPWFVNKNMPGWGGLTISRWPEETYWKDGHVDRIGDCPLATIKEGLSTWENKFPAEANAKLIAAAPELLSACEMALAYLGLPTNEITRADYDQIKAAIAKATT